MTSTSDRWCDNDLKSKLEVEVNNLCDETTIISRMPEGNVYHVMGHVVKERMGINGPKQAVYREYLIGKRMNRLGAPHMVKTIGYTETKCSSRIIVELIRGVTLSKYLRSACKNKVTSVILHVVLILGQLQQEYGFCHYGLHSGNVMITELKKKKEFTYTIFGRHYKIRTKYYPTIIDLGRSYVRGVPDMFYEGICYEALTTPGIFDGQNDYAYILWSVRNYVTLPKTNRILIVNGLFKNDIKPKLNRENIKVPAYLTKDESLWAGRNECTDKPQHIIKQINKKGVDHCSKKLNGYCVYKKKQRIRNRKYSNKIVFRTLVKELMAISSK